MYRYCVCYLNNYSMDYIYRCYANSEKEAIKDFKKSMKGMYEEITDVWCEEG